MWMAPSRGKSLKTANCSLVGSMWPFMSSFSSGREQRSTEAGNRRMRPSPGRRGARQASASAGDVDHFRGGGGRQQRGIDLEVVRPLVGLRVAVVVLHLRRVQFGR